MPVKGDDFIDRVKHLKSFKAYIDSNQHIMIKAPRRFGKTSLIVQLFEISDYKKIYIDIKRSPSLQKLSEQIIDKAYSLAGFTGIIQKTKESISGLLKELRASLKIDIEIAQITIETLERNEKSQIDESEFFLYALDLVEKIAKSQGVNIKFAMDEFQDILDIADVKILDKMRSIMQHHECVTYIFLGSIESVMNKIFSSKSSAFFHFARIIDLGGLDCNELLAYSQEFFTKHGISYDDSLENLITFLEGHPYYSVKTLQTIYYRAIEEGKSITKTECTEALKIAIYETKSYLEEIIEKLKQKKHHYAVLWSLANGIKNKNIDAPTLYKTYKSLEDMGYIKKESRGEYIITDIFLKILLQQNNDAAFTLAGEIEFVGLWR
jgi:AAA+ ATPase superfamily predicted ATPase